MCDEEPNLKPNPDHKFISAETQMVLAKLNKLEKKIFPIFHHILMSSGGFVKINQNVFFNSNTQEFVLIKSTITKDNKSVFRNIATLQKSYNNDINVVVCYINCEDFISEIDFGLSKLTKTLGGENALNYLFSVNKEKNVKLMRSEINRKLKEYAEGIIQGPNFT